MSAYSGIYATKDPSNVSCRMQNTKKLLSAIQNKRHGMLPSGTVLLHDKALLHTAACTRALLECINWELFDLQPGAFFKRLPPVYVSKKLVDFQQ
jgi:hypothetical protein